MNTSSAFRAALGLTIALGLSSCASDPKPLDLSALPQGSIPLTSIQLIVPADLDGSLGGSGFLGDFFYANMGAIQDGLSVASGISVDASAFLKAVATRTLAVSRKLFVSGGSPNIVRYTWELGASLSPRAEFVLAYNPDREGRVNVVGKIRMDDPRYKPGYETSVSVKIGP